MVSPEKICTSNILQFEQVVFIYLGTQTHTHVTKMKEKEAVNLNEDERVGP